MNNYKFRGKTADGKWAYGNIIEYGKECHIFETENAEKDKNPLAHMPIVRPETVGQWAGLKDKNGKEIYEGDYLKDIGLVSFDKGAIFAGKVLLYNFSIEKLEVISNPELLEEK